MRKKTRKKKNSTRYSASLPKTRLMGRGERKRERARRTRVKVGKEVEGLFRKQLGNG